MKVKLVKRSILGALNYLSDNDMVLVNRKYIKDKPIPFIEISTIFKPLLEK